MIKIGMILGDRYEILEKIGTGGMSDVYKAVDYKLNRPVAVKVLKQEFSDNDNFVSKFRVEAQAAAGLGHNNIVNVYDVGQENGINYIVMELVEGITLKKYIEKKVRLSVKESISIAIQVSLGIEAAHNNGIIHRDIKPQNIIISRDGKVKVTDFGIAKAATSNTITSNVMGSVHYTAPEQARGGYSDEKSDIYSLGITMFEMVTGRVPFNGETTVEIAIKHIQDPMPSPCEFVPDLPLSVEQIILKCTQKSPNTRYQKMPELVEDLKRALINPDGDFVVIDTEDNEGKTRIVQREDAPPRKKPQKREPLDGKMRLNDQGRSKSSGSGGRRGNTGKINTGRINTPRSKRNGADDYDSGMEKITTILAAIAAIIIGIIVLILAGRAMGISLPLPFFGGDEVINEENENTEGEDENSSEDVEDNGDNESESGIPIPNVVGLSLAEATATLEREGFKVAKTEGGSDTVPRGNVISQSPAGDRKAERGTLVTIEISIGKSQMTEKVKMPDIVGMSEMDATVTLTEAGLTIGSREEAPNDDAALTDKVFYQSIQESTMVERGTAVDIKVSTGPAQTTYSFNADVDSPGLEDLGYVPGSPVTVVLNASDGKELLRTTTQNFPLKMNLSGIAGTDSGIITFTYTGVGEPTIAQDPATGDPVTIPGAPVEKSIQRPVSFTPEG